MFARLTIHDFIIQPEVLWFKSGKVFDFNVDPTLNTAGVALNPTVTLTHQNLAVPIFLGYQLDGKLIKVRGNVGPVMYFVLSQENRTEGIMLTYCMPVRANVSFVTRSLYCLNMPV